MGERGGRSGLGARGGLSKSGRGGAGGRGGRSGRGVGRGGRGPRPGRGTKPGGRTGGNFGRGARVKPRGRGIGPGGKEGRGKKEPKAATAAAALDPGDDLGDDDYLLGTVTADDGENGVPVDVVGEKGAEGDAEGRGEKRKLSVKEKIKMKKHKSRAGGEVYEKEKERARGIASSSSEEQSQWLWDMYLKMNAGSELEKEAFAPESIAMLKGGSLCDAICGFFHDKGGEEFLCKVTKKTRKGAPIVMVVTVNAAWAATACGDVKGLNTEGVRVGKMFARHFKVEEQQQWLSEHCTNVVVGTPNRLLKLADSGALQTTRLQLVIYHVALDVKQRHLLELQETRGDCWDLFFRHVVPRLKEGEPECRMALSTVALDKDLQESA